MFFKDQSSLIPTCKLGSVWQEDERHVESYRGEEVGDGKHEKDRILQQGKVHHFPECLMKLCRHGDATELAPLSLLILNRLHKKLFLTFATCHL